MTSLNAYCGPVDFLVATSSTLASDLLRRDSVFNGSEEDANGGADEDEDGQRAEPDPEVPRLRGEQPKHLLLQYRLRSTCQLPGKPLTAQPEGNQRAPPDAPEHSLEDGSIYEVNEDPDVWVRGRPVDWGKEGEVRRSKVSSTAVFAGGRGYRRVGQAGSADSDHTLMVWQLPLALSQ